MKTKKMLLPFMLFLCLLLPLLNHFGLQLLYAREINGNVAYSGIAPVIENVIEFFNVVSVFSGYALITYSVMRYSVTESRGLLLVGTLCTAFMQLLPLAVAFFSLTGNLFSANIGFLLVNALLNCIIFILLLLAVFAIAAVVRVRWQMNEKNKGIPVSAPLDGSIFSLKHPSLRVILFSSLLYFSAALLQAIPVTAADFSEYGLPMNMNEFVYIVEPYLSAVLFFFIGYFVMLGIYFFLDTRNNAEA